MVSNLSGASHYVSWSLEYTSAEPRKHRRISGLGDIVLTLKHRTDTESRLLPPVLEVVLNKYAKISIWHKEYPQQKQK